MKLTIVSPEQTLFDGEVEIVTLPGTKGRFTVLPHHDALISTLTSGVIRYVSDGQEVLLPVSAGYVEILHDIVSVCIKH